MKLSELMAGYTPEPNFEGFVTADQWVVAIGIGEAATEKDYTVIDGGVTAVEISFNPTASDKTYLRKGASSTKTGTQFIATVTGDVQHGDDFQDHCAQADIIFGVGQSVVVPFVAFSLMNGKGFKGTAAVMVNSYGGGTAGENAPFSVDLKSVGTAPVAYTYSVA